MREPRAATEMLAGWAHDLGKPLQVIAIHGRKLANEDGLKGETLELARAIVALSDDALRVVDRLMESAQPDRAKTARSDDLRSTLIRVLAVVRGLHPDGRLLIRGPIPRLEVDRSNLLFSVLVNVVDNALRAGSCDQLVSIGVRSDRDGLRVEVIDDGAGMTESVRELAFEPYFSTQETSPRATGLGLYECRRLLEECGGQITLESMEGRGTRASVLLPWRLIRRLYV